MKHVTFILFLLGFFAFNTTIHAQLNIQLKLGVTGNDVHIYWGAEDQAEVEQYILHRSTNGRVFESVASIDGNGAFESTYEHFDVDLANAYYAYRMQVLYSDGTEEVIGYEIVNVNVRPVFGDSPHFPDAISDQPINY